MADDTAFDVASAHRHFSATCFNKAWEFIDKKSRTPEDDEEMMRLSQASIWHWTQREDCKPRNLSIGYWQASRIQSILKRPAEALRYGELCLKHSRNEPPFYMGYAYEALARAAKLDGDGRLAGEYLSEAARYAGAVEEADEQKMLLDDLNALKETP